MEFYCAEMRQEGRTFREGFPLDRPKEFGRKKEFGGSNWGGVPRFFV
jgi:hypothetical protein